MQPLATAVLSLVRDEEGATTAEYAIIVIMMAAISFLVLTGMDGSMELLYDAAQSNVETPASFAP